MKLRPSTLRELKALGLDTDWPSDEFAQRVIEMERNRINAQQRKLEEQREARLAAANWPEELKVGAEIEEVHSERHVVIVELDYEKAEVKYMLLPHPWEKESDMKPQEWDMADELKRYREGYIRLVQP